jgi:predicted DNA-binding ribbon-helix-helix protein
MGAAAANYTLGCDQLTSNAVCAARESSYYTARGAAFWGSRFMTGQQQKSRVTKRSIVIAGHKTSVSLEDQFWDALRALATAQGITPATLIASINAGRQHNNLSSAIRLFVLNHYRSKVDGAPA